MAMIRHLKEKYKIRSIAIEDENFVVFKKRLTELCHRFIDEKLDISWSCAGRVDQVDFDTLTLMKRAGCWSISYGIESGSSEILNTVKKNITKNQIVEALKNTRKAGIETKGYFIIGLPGETMQTISETRQFALSIPLDYLQMSFLCVFPGTEIVEHADTFGVYDNDWNSMNIWTPNFIPHGLTREILVKESKKIFRAFYFRPKIIIKFVLKMMTPKYFLYYCKDGLKILRFLLSSR